MWLTGTASRSHDDAGGVCVIISVHCPCGLTIPILILKPPKRMYNKICGTPAGMHCSLSTSSTVLVQGNTAAAPVALGDRTNKVANSRSIPTAVFQKQPKGSTSGKERDCPTSLRSEYAVPAGASTDENRIEGIRHDDHVRDSQQCNVNTCADIVHAKSMSSSCTLANHEAEVVTESDTMMPSLSLSDSKEAAKMSAQEAQLSQNFSKIQWQHSDAVQEQAVCTSASSGSTVSAIEAVTVSPGRRVFAAHVTVTRPTTPASPASAY